MFSHNISAMVIDLTLLIPSTVFKLVLSKLMALSLAIPKFADTSPWVYHILPKLNLRLIKNNQNVILLGSIFTPGYKARKIIKQYYKENKNKNKQHY